MVGRRGSERSRNRGMDSRLAIPRCYPVVSMLTITDSQAFFSLFISAVNLNRLRRKRPFVPLPINWIFDLGITFNAIALAVPGLGDVFEYRECWQMPEDEATCLRHALPVRILTGLMLATGLVIG